MRILPVRAMIDPSSTDLGHTALVRWLELHCLYPGIQLCIVKSGGRLLGFGLQSILACYCGGVGERLKPPVLKTGVHFVDREFESRPLRQPLFRDPVCW